MTNITIPREVVEQVIQAVSAKQRVTLWENEDDRVAFNAAISTLRAAIAQADQPVVVPQEPINALDDFEQWWQERGRFYREDGGQYEKSFAWAAWLHQLMRFAAASPSPAPAVPDAAKPETVPMEHSHIIR